MLPTAWRIFARCPLLYDPLPTGISRKSGRFPFFLSGWAKNGAARLPTGERLCMPGFRGSGKWAESPLLLRSNPHPVCEDIFKHINTTRTPKIYLIVQIPSL